MTTQTLGKSKLTVPRVAVGCMRINKLSHEDLVKHLEFCISNGLYFFDHADIYGHGDCERKFAEAFHELKVKREDIILQSKCGIIPGKMYDFSKEHILSSVDGILKRLNTEYLDVLILHRPDALVEPEEVAETFDLLQSAGKVRNFGVSNHRPKQIELLKKYLSVPILVNQVQFSIPFSNLISSGLEANMESAGAVNRDGEVLDFCRLNDITIQAWSPYQYGTFAGNFVGNREKFLELNKVLDRLAAKYNVSPSAIACAWILRHPAKMQLIAGTTSIAHMQEVMDGSCITLTREEWYELYLSAGHILP